MKGKRTDFDFGSMLMKNKNLIIVLISFIVFLLFFIFLQRTCEYHFYYIEQDQMFRFSANYFQDKIVRPGGFALVIAQFLLQFFSIKYLGATILSILLTFIVFVVGGIMKRFESRKEFLILSLIPSVLLMYAQFQFNYQLQGTIAFLLAVVALYTYLMLKNYSIRLITGLVLTVLLFIFAGSVFVLFAVSALLFELLRRNKKWYLSGTFLIVATVVIVFSIRTGMLGEFKFAALPDMYYNNLLKSPPYSIFAWLSMPLCSIVAFVSPYLNNKDSRVKSQVFFSIGFVLIGVFIFTAFEKENNPESTKYKKLDYYSYTSQWDKIIEINKERTNNYLHLNILNRALSEKGELADRMFAFNQNGVYSLMVEGNVPALLTDIYFTMGDIATSQRYAFEAYISSQGNENPRMLQRLVQTNLIFGAFPVAEKYISLLEQTLFYKKWASAQRKFLYNDATVESDPLLGNKRKGLHPEGEEYNIFGIERDLEDIAAANPSDKKAIEYLGAIYLLNKDIVKLHDLFDKYYNGKVLQKMPRSFQEAVMIMSVNFPDVLDKYAVSPEVQNGFYGFNKDVTDNQQNYYLKDLIFNKYGNTYWYYYMFK